MTTITLDEIQRDVMACIRKVQAGESFVIVQADQPVAEIRPVTPSANGLRPFGLAKGEITIADDFDDQLPEDILREFEGR